ncbi:hypothetical protein CYMTET_34937, partial [Cymbomonas tetramitiformis]
VIGAWYQEVRSCSSQARIQHWLLRSGRISRIRRIMALWWRVSVAARIPRLAAVLMRQRQRQRTLKAFWLAWRDRINALHNAVLEQGGLVRWAWTLWAHHTALCIRQRGALVHRLLPRFRRRRLQMLFKGWWAVLDARAATLHVAAWIQRRRDSRTLCCALDLWRWLVRWGARFTALRWRQERHMMQAAWSAWQGRRTSLLSLSLRKLQVAQGFVASNLRRIIGRLGEPDGLGNKDGGYSSAGTIGWVFGNFINELLGEKASHCH